MNTTYIKFPTDNLKKLFLDYLDFSLFSDEFKSKLLIIIMSTNSIFEKREMLSILIDTNEFLSEKFINYIHRIFEEYFNLELEKS